MHIFTKNAFITIILLTILFNICSCEGDDSGNPDGSYVDTGFELTGYPGRKYIIHLPDGYNTAASYSLMLVLHGGGSNKEQMQRIASPNGITGEEGSMDALADQKGFIVAYPNGTALPEDPASRSFNAGGGSDGWECLYSTACQNDVDDIAYFNALIEHLQSSYNVDETKIYCGGFSNGAAMCHRLACELSTKIAAIASVAGANHFETTASCSPGKKIPVLSLHGTWDYIWPYEGGLSLNPNTTGNLYAVYKPSDSTDTMRGWASRNGCNTTPADTAMPDTANDGTTVTRKDFEGCGDGTEVLLYEITRGGHTWPGGWEFWPGLGTTCKDINASEIMLNFFSDH